MHTLVNNQSGTNGNIDEHQRHDQFNYYDRVRGYRRRRPRRQRQWRQDGYPRRTSHEYGHGEQQTTCQHHSCHCANKEDAPRAQSFVRVNRREESRDNRDVNNDEPRTNSVVLLPHQQSVNTTPAVHVNGERPVVAVGPVHRGQQLPDMPVLNPVNPAPHVNGGWDYLAAELGYNQGVGELQVPQQQHEPATTPQQARAGSESSRVDLDADENDLLMDEGEH